MKVGIIGLGLIGGSLAHDLSAKGYRVLGADRSRSTLRSARRAGVIAQALGPSLEGIEEADLCVRLLSARKSWSRECSTLQSEIMLFARQHTACASDGHDVTFSLT